jgi:hypothetical protein
MDPDLQKLQNLFSCVEYTGFSDTDCIVKESDPGAKTQTIFLHGGDTYKDWFLLYSDDGRVACPFYVADKTRWNKQKCKCKNAKLISPLLSTKSGFFHHKACDAIFVALIGGRLRIVYIELKSNSLGNVTEQLKSMSHFMKYAIGVFNDGRTNAFAIDEYFVCFKCVNGKNSHKRFSSLSSNVSQPTEIGTMSPGHFRMEWFL